MRKVSVRREEEAKNRTQFQRVDWKLYSLEQVKELGDVHEDWIFASRIDTDRPK